VLLVAAVAREEEDDEEEVRSFSRSWCVANVTILAQSVRVEKERVLDPPLSAPPPPQQSAFCSAQPYGRPRRALHTICHPSPDLG
jgi:hypothetical protein